MRSVYKEIENRGFDPSLYNEFWSCYGHLHWGWSVGDNWWPVNSVEPRAEGEHVFDLYINWNRM